MKTLTVDDHQRVRLPDVKPRTKLAYTRRGDGTITLTEVKAGAEEGFPLGSLKKFVTPERNRELLDLVKGCSLEVSE